MIRTVDQQLSPSRSSIGRGSIIYDAIPLLVLPLAALLLVPDEWPRWALMWMLAFSIFAGCKWLTWKQAGIDNVPVWKQTAYLVAWPGLDAVAFLRPSTGRHVSQPRLREWLFAFTKLAIGLAFVLVSLRWVAVVDPYWVGWCGMLGIVFTLHFGLFHLLSCTWRRFGIDARPLMDWPLLAVGVSEFWGMRWNRAFRDLTHRFLFRPLTSRFGPRLALSLGFVFSGLVHELVITVPAGGGYGGPTLFFLIQGVALFVERSTFGRSIGLGTAFRGWLFVCCVTLLPVTLLFPPAFVEGIIVPFLQFLKAV